MTNNFSKFDSQPACEELADFIPSESELAEALPDFGRGLHSVRDRFEIQENEAALRSSLYLMAD